MIRGIDDRDVGAVSADGTVGLAVRRVEVIVPLAAEQLVVSSTTDEAVASGPSGEDVVLVVPDQDVSRDAATDALDVRANVVPFTDDAGNDRQRVFQTLAEARHFRLAVMAAERAKKDYHGPWERSHLDSYGGGPGG